MGTITLYGGGGGCTDIATAMLYTVQCTIDNRLVGHTLQYFEEVLPVAQP